MTSPKMLWTPSTLAPVWVLAIGAAGCGGDVVVADGSCNPLRDTCPVGAYCQYTEGELQCIDEGVAQRDEPCDPDMCKRTSMCMPDTFGSSFCQQPCNLQLESEDCDNSRHTCFAAIADSGAKLDFGLCRY